VSPGVLELGDLRWQDGVDIAILTLVLFRVYVWLRGTVALQVALGMLTLVLLSYAASALGFVLSAYVLQAIGAVAVLVAVVIFREEIRRALMRASPLRLFFRRDAVVSRERREYTALAEALFELAKDRLGALVVVARRDPLGEHVTGGVAVGALVSGPLVEALFQKASPLHDGAAIVDRDRLTVAGAFLPLARGELPQRYGTRHSAAIGLSEVADALVIAVSEERGEVSLAENGAISPVPDATTLARLLLERAAPPGDATARRHTLVKDAVVGAVIFVGVVAAWNVVANRGDAVEERSVPVELHGVPAGAALEALPPEVLLRLRGPRRLLVGVDGADLHAWVDAAAARGAPDLAVSTTAPPGLQVVAVDPPRITVLERRSLRVEAELAGRFARVVRVTPSEVMLVGRLGELKGLRTVKTLPINEPDVSGDTVVTTLAIPAGLRLVDEREGQIVVELAPR
jgi:diadenylate cyclase